MNVDDLISKWEGTAGGAERANYALFLQEFCNALALPPPKPATGGEEAGTYQFEAFVRRRLAGEPEGSGRIDLYKPGCFVLEAKQSRLAVADKSNPELFDAAPAAPAAPSGAKYDRLMRDALAQAEGYARALPAAHGWPPFIIVCDVGRAFEVYFDQSGIGKDYAYFPNRLRYRIGLAQLRDPAIQVMFRAIWTDPASINPRNKAAEVTRQVSERLAIVSKWLEAPAKLRTKGKASGERSMAVEETSLFLMRLLFCMFAEDVQLLPKDSFRDFLGSCLPPEDGTERPIDSAKLRAGLSALWETMNRPQGDRWCWVVGGEVRYFNGGLFEHGAIYEIGWRELRELHAASMADWKAVEPAIFGTLLEQALESDERGKLGAHYTPRPYVERIVEATVMEPLRADWVGVQARVAALAESDAPAALTAARAFHDRLLAIGVLDPACGTGNFLYVAMELLLGLEAQVLELMAGFGARIASGIGPRQFHWLELNPRAAVIAELVLWIGWLRYRLANDPASITDPVLEKTGSINFGQHGGYDAVLALDATGTPDVANPRAPRWPKADFIVGNPPFMGGKDIRAKLGSDYAEAMRKAHPHVPPSADFVMHWWDRAAAILTAPDTRLRRFGFVTTNSITQTFSRRVIEARMAGERPLSLCMAIPDHPWTKASKDTAAVRIAMTVAAAGEHDGIVLDVKRETALDTDAPLVELAPTAGRINADLTVGADVTCARPLRANEGICSPGVKLHGAGFIVTPADAVMLGLGRREGLEAHIRPYRHGRDLTGNPRGFMVIDLFGLSEADVRQRFPEVYQHVLNKVKPERDANRRATYSRNWWIHGEPRGDIRPALAGLSRYIATVETSKHRTFQFVDNAILADNMVIAIASDAGLHLGVLSSRLHVEWAIRAGGWLGFGNDPRYSKSRCFDPFPLPDAPPLLARRIAEIADELDATRKLALSENPDLTLTDLYNLVEALRAGRELTPAERDAAMRGRAGIVRKLHDDLDAAVAEAYGWPADLPPAEIVARLVALNAERAAEEAAGHVRWLRPEYQAARFGKAPSGP